ATATTIRIAASTRARRRRSSCPMPRRRGRGSTSTPRRSEKRRAFRQGIIWNMSKFAEVQMRRRMRGVLVLVVLGVLVAPAQGVRGQGPAPAVAIDPRIVKLIDSISEERMQQLLTKLVSFGTRNTLSDA